MAWGRIDDGHWRHRKVAALDDDLRKPCLALFWLAVSWANDHGTDGRVSMTGLRQLDGTTQEADELVRVGLWDKDGKGYAIHDFLDFNKSAQQVAEAKAQRTEAGKERARQRWPDSDSLSGSLSTSLSGSVSETLSENDAPYPVSRTPVYPSPTSGAYEHIDDEAKRLLEELTGKPITVAGLRQLVEYERQLADHPRPKVDAAYHRVVKAYPTKPTARQLVWAVRSVLEPFASPADIKALERQETADSERKAHEARLAKTRALIDERRPA